MKDKHYKEIASLYADKYGQELKEEMKTLDSRFHLDLSDETDKKIKTKIRQIRAKKYIPAAAIAACFLMALGVSLNYRGVSDHADGQEQLAQSAAEPEYEFIALSFEMPAGFSVSAYEQDRNQTIYLIDNTALDPIVLVAEEYENQPFGDGLIPLDLDNQTVYGLSHRDYKILKFQKDDILYTLTCKYEIDTLINFTKNIL